MFLSEILSKSKIKYLKTHKFPLLNFKQAVWVHWVDCSVTACGRHRSSPFAHVAIMCPSALLNSRHFSSENLLSTLSTRKGNLFCIFGEQTWHINKTITGRLQLHYYKLLLSHKVFQFRRDHAHVVTHDGGHHHNIECDVPDRVVLPCWPASAFYREKLDHYRLVVKSMFNVHEGTYFLFTLILNLVPICSKGRSHDLLRHGG